jgi:flagellar biogenesis protein FliO
MTQALYAHMNNNKKKAWFRTVRFFFLCLPITVNLLFQAIYTFKKLTQERVNKIHGVELLQTIKKTQKFGGRGDKSLIMSG